MVQSIPLKKLVLSPRNVRKSSDVLADLQLRADIAARGLLQNLVVRKAKRGKFEVEAGGRRLAALQALADEGTLPKVHEVTCLVIEGEESELREASLAENFQRLAMNPADEAQAFAAIIEAGANVEDVARRFGLTARFVEGRLRLAGLAPCIFEALAEGAITLEMAKAYGAISDVDRQAHVFAELQDAWYQVTPDYDPPDGAPMRPCVVPTLAPSLSGGMHISQLVAGSNASCLMTTPAKAGSTSCS